MKPPQKNTAAAASTSQSGSRAGALALLRADHRKVAALFRKYKASDSPEEKSGLTRQICTELIVHTKLEEEIFYPACREAGIDDTALDEAQVEHDSAKVLMAGLLHNQPASPFHDARMAVLAEYIKHHVEEEEKPDSGIFAKARAAKLDMNALGLRLQERKEELMAQAGTDELSPSAPGSLDLQSFTRGKQEQFTMARQNDRYRDDQGRFADDEQRGGRGYAARSGEREERDERGRFMGEEERGERGYAQRHGGGNERDERGRFMSDDERSGGRSWRDEDSGYSARDSGGRGRGWYGDSQGHSRASEQGWESRGRSGSSRYEDDERGQRGYASQGNERDERGRFMSEDERSGGRSSRYEDSHQGWRGDDGRGRGGLQDEEDRGRSRYSSRDDEDQRSGRNSQEGRGHGGWFGDSKAHSEASRRGWQNR
jgi:hypothetical protein